MRPDSFDQATGIRQRTSHAEKNKSGLSAVTLEEENSSEMNPVRAAILTISILGVISFSTLASLFSARYAFFGFHGNMDQAAKSCWETAVLFVFVSLVTALPSIATYYRNWKKLRAIHRKQVLPGAYRP